MSRHPGLLDPHASALIVVDVQERFRAVIDRFEMMAENARRLVLTFRELELPVIVTEQYPKGLGHTIPELLEVLADTPVGEKTAFSSMGCSEVPGRLEASGVRTVLVCGIETHVCVNQTVHDLLQAGYRAHVATDAVSSRRPSDREAARRRLEAAGTVLTTAEMASFELMVDARHPAFRAVQALYK